ncbi:MAG TPA: alpha-glucan family phosphorylase, partial [Myxococcaceae bacterium]|nr:alpha-glucan family phosphorylase [Myxococcaceae bacterium]
MSTTSNPSADMRGQLISRLPPALSALGRLAYNYWWSWQPGGEALFRDIDPERWESSGRNPVRLLIQTPRLAEAAVDPALVARAAALDRALSSQLARPFADAAPASAASPIAFFCAEYGVHVSLPIYSGGLGVLAGDYLKEASDRCVPLVAVGLLYRRGYFHQRLDPSGWQHEWWQTQRPEDLPTTAVAGPGGAPLTISLPLRGERVVARVWRADIGRIPLFLLDTDVPENSPLARWISAQLYVGNREVRLMQYALLGAGGVRALAAMGIDPAVVHLNEGHPALAPIALAAEEIARGAPLPQAIEAARSRVVFTTHTPVAAGNESYSAEEVEPILGRLIAELGIALRDLLALARPAEGGERLGMTELALRTSRHANAVSRRHGEVSRAMWCSLWPGQSVDAVPITHVTNGVHLPTWMAQPMRALLERYLGAGWEREANDPQRWAAIDRIPDEEIWSVRNELRASLVQFVRAQSVTDRLARGEPLSYVEEAAVTFDPNVLTVGFARRVASYKRLQLLVRDPARAIALLRGSIPIQVIIAGKAHPRDDEAKRAVQIIFGLKDQPGAGARVAFLEDYDLSIAHALVSGCDVWVNLPRPPLEASGTSGMKAAFNGGLNLSVLDGWWSEAFDGG